MAARIRKGDQVIVIAGSAKGKSGKVISVRPQDNKAVVEGVNLVTRHTKATAQQEGGRISKPMALDLSNLAIKDPKDGKATRVKFQVNDDGKKIRYSVRSGELIDG